MPYPFLSDEWLVEARLIRAEFEGNAPTVAQALRMNLVVTEVPFGEGQILAHIDTTGGLIDIEVDHIAEPDLTVTVDYATAKAILVEGNFQAAMQAFMAGKIRVDGDMAALMALQTGPGPDERAGEMAARLRAITD